MRAVVLLALAACDHTSTGHSLVAGGDLISIAEGETRSLDLSEESTLGPGAPTWVQITNMALQLAPPCTLITGTDGPPSEVELSLVTASGTTPVIVEIHPSGDGTCMPTVTGCIHHAHRGPGNPDGLHPCDETGATYCGTCSGSDCDEPTTGSTAEISFVDKVMPPYFSDPTILDRALVLSLVNPDPPDHLNLLFSTGAPIHFNPLTPGSYCAEVPNEDVIGSFILSFIATRGNDATAPAVASGRYQLTWNSQAPTPSPYGAELEWCATNSGGCTIQRSFDPAGPQWCVQKIANARTTLGMRIWASQGDAQKTGYNLLVHAAWAATAPDIGLTLPPVDGTTQVDFQVDPTTIPADAILELNTVQGNDVDITLQGSQIGNDALDPQYTQPFHMAIHVGTCQ